MILISLVSGVSVAKLIVAGILPRILMAVGFIAVCWWVSWRRGYPVSKTRVPKPELAALAAKSFPAVVLPIPIILGLRFGFATTTEVAVLSVVYSLVLSLVVYRDLTWTRFCDNMVEAGMAILRISSHRCSVG